MTPLGWRAYGGLLALVLAVLIVGVVAGRTLRTGSASTQTVALVAAQSHVLTLLNARRAAAHLAPLRLDGVLSSLAAIHSRDEIRGGWFAHDDPQGMTFAERMAYLHRRVVAEVLAYGTASFGTAQGLVSLWMGSPIHRRIILNPALRRVGIAVITGSFQGQRAAQVATVDLSS